MAWNDVTNPTPSKLSAAEASSRAAVTHRSGGQLPVRLLSERSTPLTRIEWEVREAYLLLERIARSVLPLAVEPVGGLAIGVWPGVYRDAAGDLQRFLGAASVTLDDNTADQCVWLDVATGTIDYGAAWPATLTDYVPLALVDTAGGAVQAETVRDMRPALALQIQASTASPTGTTGQAFTLDSANAGAERDSALRFNRGSSDAEDAALLWDAAAGVLRALSQHTTGTRAPLDCAELRIGGSSAVTSDGAAKVQAAVAGDGLAASAGALAVSVDDSTLALAGGDVVVKDGGITAAKLSVTLARKLLQVTIPNSSGASPRTVRVQVTDLQGNAVTEAVVVGIRVAQDAWGAALATSATIAVGGTAGTLIRTVTADKHLVARTDATGALDIVVTDGTSETVYLLAEPAARSRALDCGQVGTVVVG